MATSEWHSTISRFRQQSYLLVFLATSSRSSIRTVHLETVMSSIDKPSGWWPWTRSIRSSAHGEPAIPWLASPPTSTAPQTGAAVSTPSVQSIVSTPIPPLESETLRPVIANISSPAQPASDTAVTASTAFMQYNKCVTVQPKRQ